MKVIIAEKPSVAQGIASVVGARQRKDGYLTGDGYAVTWAFGHLVGLAMPESYGFSGFRREHLPILPQEFRLVPRQVREGKVYKDDPGVVRQLEVLRELFDRCESIIVATDAGREGELIFRYVYNYLGCTKPFVRLWISSLTDKAIREGVAESQGGKPLRQSLPLRQSPQRGGLARGHQQFSGAQPCRRAGRVLFGTGADTHIGDDLLTIPGEQTVRTPEIFPDKGFGGQGRHRLLRTVTEPLR